VLKLLKNIRLNLRVGHRLSAYIALFAILVQATAPIAAHAMQPQNGVSSIVLCTAHGMVQIQVADDAEANQVDASGRSVKIKSAHPCALCVLAASNFLPPISFSIFSFNPNSLANTLFVRLGGAGFVFASVVQYHAPPTGPPLISFV
jgi:hypothetical protein